MVSKFTGEHQKIKSIHSRPRERLTVVKVLSMERLLILSVFYAFSAPEFTLILNLASLLADGIVTVFLPVVSSYKELFTVAAGYDDAIGKSIIFSDVFRGRCL